MIAAPDALITRLRRVRREARDRALGRDPDRRTVREDLALRYLAGDGIEIGALDFPLRLPRGARARYVDRKPSEQLHADFPELASHQFVEVDVVDDGERLGSFADGELDFVIASHMLEHTQDPLGTLQAHARVLRPGGVLYLALPDRRHTFDHERPLTPFEHVLADHVEGPARSRREHYREWVRHVERFDEADVEWRAEELDGQDASIHFHVWELESFVATIGAAQAALALPLRLEHAEMNGHEFLVVLRRTPAAAENA